MTLRELLARVIADDAAGKCAMDGAPLVALVRLSDEAERMIYALDLLEEVTASAENMFLHHHYNMSHGDKLTRASLLTRANAFIESQKD